MIVYHGSDRTVSLPDIKHSFRNLDFGRRFYVTTVREQAERWARRKADFTKDARPFLNVYDMKIDMEKLFVRRFDESLSDWIEFVCDCRDDSQIYTAYDVIIGKVADDKVFRVVDMYHSGIWDKERALREIRVYPAYDQIAFITQRAIDRLLQFQNSVEVI